MSISSRLRSPAGALAVGIAGGAALADFLALWFQRGLVIIPSLAGPMAVLNRVFPTLGVVLPLAGGYLAARWAAAGSLSARTVAGMAFVAGLLGRYAGIALFDLARGGGLPSPLVLATWADIDLAAGSPMVYALVMVGLIATGVFPVVGAFAGLGLADRVG